MNEECLLNDCNNDFEEEVDDDEEVETIKNSHENKKPMLNVECNVLYSF